MRLYLHVDPAVKSIKSENGERSKLERAATDTVATELSYYFSDHSMTQKKSPTKLHTRKKQGAAVDVGTPRDSQTQIVQPTSEPCTISENNVPDTSIGEQSGEKLSTSAQPHAGQKFIGNPAKGKSSSKARDFRPQFKLLSRVPNKGPSKTHNPGIGEDGQQSQFDKSDLVSPGRENITGNVPIQQLSIFLYPPSSTIDNILADRAKNGGLATDLKSATLRRQRKFGSSLKREDVSRKVSVYNDPALLMSMVQQTTKLQSTREVVEAQLQMNVNKTTTQGTHLIPRYTDWHRHMIQYNSESVNPPQDVVELDPLADNIEHQSRTSSTSKLIDFAKGASSSTRQAIRRVSNTGIGVLNSVQQLSSSNVTEKREPPLTGVGQLCNLSIRELKCIIERENMTYVDCVEKQDIQQRAYEALQLKEHRAQKLEFRKGKRNSTNSKRSWKRRLMGSKKKDDARPVPNNSHCHVETEPSISQKSTNSSWDPNKPKYLASANVPYILLPPPDPSQVPAPDSQDERSHQQLECQLMMVEELLAHDYSLMQERAQTLDAITEIRDILRELEVREWDPPSDVINSIPEESEHAYHRSSTAASEIPDDSKSSENLDTVSSLDASAVNDYDPVSCPILSVTSGKIYQVERSSGAV